MLGIGVGRRRTGKGKRKPNGDTAGGRDEQVDAIITSYGIGESDALPDADEVRVVAGMLSRRSTSEPISAKKAERPKSLPKIMVSSPLDIF